MNVGELLVRLGVDDKGLQEGLSRAENSARRAASTIGSILENALSFATGMGIFETVSAGFDAIRRTVVGFNADMEQARIAFTTFLGSADAAAYFVDQLAKFAAETPFEFPQVQAAAKRFLAFGWAAKDVIPTLEAVGNAVAGLGGNGEMIDRVTLALGQMAAKGKVSAEELMQLAEAGIPAYQILQEKLGLTADQVANIGNEGIAANVAIKALVEGMNERFGGMMAAQATSFTGLLSTIKDNLTIMLADMSSGLFAGMKDGLMALKNTTDALFSSFKEGGFQQVFRDFVPPDLQARIGQVVNAVAPLVVTLRQLFQSLIPVFRDVGGVLVAAFATVTSVVAPALNVAAAAVRNLAQSWSSISHVVYASVAAFLAFRSVLAISSLIDTVRTGLAGLQSALVAIREAYVAATLPAVLFGGAVSGTTLLIAAAVAGIVAAGVLLWQNWDSISQGISDAWNSAVEFVTGLAAQLQGWLQEHARAVYDTLVGAWQWIKEHVLSHVAGLVEGIISGLGKVVAWVKGLFGGVAETVNETLNTGKDYMADWLNSFKGSTYDAEKGAQQFAAHTSKAMQDVGGGAAAASKEMDKLANKAQQVSQSIEREWVQTTKTQLEQLDIWKDEQLATLEETAAANENYERDVARVWETYEVKKKSIVEQTTKSIEQEWAKVMHGQIADVDQWEKDQLDALSKIQSAYAGFEEAQRRVQEIARQRRAEIDKSSLGNVQQSLGRIGDITTTVNGSGAAKGIADIIKQSRSQLDELSKAFDDINNAWVNSTEEGRQRIKQVLDQAKVDYQENEQGKLDFTQARAQAEAEIEKWKVDQMTQYFASGKALEDELTRLQNEGDLAGYMQLLNDKTAAFLAQKQGEQAYLDTYRQMQLQAEMSNLDILAGLYQTVYQNLSAGLTDAIMGAKSFGKAVEEVGKSILKYIVQVMMQKLVANAVVSAMAQKATLQSISQAHAEALAWARAAAMRAIAEAGPFGASAAIGATVAYAIALAAMPVELPGMAQGAIVTSPTLALVGEGRYAEAILPLDKDRLAKLGLGGDGNISVTQNNYGDINTEVDYDQLMADLGSAVASALRYA